MAPDSWKSYTKDAFGSLRKNPYAARLKNVGQVSHDGETEKVMPAVRTISGTVRWLLLTLTGWMLVTCSVVFGENLVVRNKSATPVAVQAATVIRGMLVRDRVHLLQVNDSTPAIALPGNKVVTIFDARNANRVLIQVPVNAGTEDLLFDINADPNSPTGVRLDRVPRR